MKVGTVTYNIAKDWDVPTLIEKCSATGMEGVELRTTHAHGVELELTKEQRADVKKMFDDSPVCLVGLGSTYEYHASDPAELRRNIEGTKEYAILARDVGASGIKVRPNRLLEDEGISKEQTLEQIGVALRECGAFAAGYGIQVRVEVHGRDTSLPRNMRTIFDAADHDNVYACWNCNGADIEDGSIKANFDLLKHKIALVHMRDLCNTDYPWQELISGLKSINYTGYCLAEIPDSPDAERVLRYYRALWDAYLKLW